MANPFFSAMGGGAPRPGLPMMGGPMGNMMQLMQQFQQFKASFTGDPKAEVEKLVQSGQISQQQLNQLQTMAQKFQSFLK